MLHILTVKEIARTVGGTLLAGDGDTPVFSVTSDSRSVQEGALFIPWKGDRFDGHDFIPDALTAGAVAAFTERDVERPIPGKCYIRVPDVKTALKDLARYRREQVSVPFVQVTGSTGKTTAKEMLATVLSEKYRTLKTVGNFNGELGTPLLLMTLTDEYEAAVVETGMDRAGQIRSLGSLVQPHIAVILNVGVAHMEFLGSRENICKAKCEIFEHLDADGIAVLNGDDDMLQKVRLPQKIYFCGRGENCNVRVTEIDDRGIEGVFCTVTTEKNRYRLHIPAPGVHMIYAASMATVIGEYLGLTGEEIVRGVAAFVPTGDRMRVERLAQGRIMLNDSYNANPDSMEAALRTLAATKAEKRIAFLGDMKELGTATEEAHRRMGTLLGELGIDTLFCTGAFCKAHMAEAARQAGCLDVRWYEKKDDAYGDLTEAFCPDTALLLKGSHFANRLDMAADYLRSYQF